MKKATHSFIRLLIDALVLAEKEKCIILYENNSQWSLEQLQSVVIPEISELLSYAKEGKIHFKYGKKQRLLESSYLITDSIDGLAHTALGKCILDLQEIYDVL